jgi:hypothetical protein
VLDDEVEQALGLFFFSRADCLDSSH